MDGQSAQQNPSILTKPPIKPVNRIIVSIVTLLLGFLIGSIAWSVLPFGKIPFFSSAQKTKVAPPSPSPKPALDESKLPISLALLQNPIVYEWRGSVKGKMTQKDDRAFTLVDDQGNSITITDKMPSGDKFKAMFFDKSSSINKQISLKDIPLGSVLLGDFFIFKGGPNTPVGSSFIKQ